MNPSSSPHNIVSSNSTTATTTEEQALAHDSTTATRATPITTTQYSPLPTMTTTSSHHIHHHIHSNDNRHTHYFINSDGITTTLPQQQTQPEQQLQRPQLQEEQQQQQQTQQQAQQQSEELDASGEEVDSSFDDEEDETSGSFSSSSSFDCLTDQQRHQHHNHHNHHHHHHHLKPLLTSSSKSSNKSRRQASTTTNTTGAPSSMINTPKHKSMTPSTARYYVSREEDGTNTPTKKNNNKHTVVGAQDDYEEDENSYTITIHTDNQPPNAHIQVKIASDPNREETGFLVTRETSSPTTTSVVIPTALDGDHRHQHRHHQLDDTTEEDQYGVDVDDEYVYEDGDEEHDDKTGEEEVTATVMTEDAEDIDGRKRGRRRSSSSSRKMTKQLMIRNEATVEVVTHSLRYQILGTVGAALYFLVCCTILLFVMNFVHARVPKVEPLPDIGHDIISHLQPEFLGDIVMISCYVCFGLSLLLSGNKRWKMATRFLFAYGTLYLIRTTTISATSLPATKNHCYYDNQPIENIWWNTFIGLVTMGSANRHCGDLLFSGHTCSITLILLVFWCYHSRYVLFNIALTLVGVTGFVFIIGTRSHYTVDVLVALYLTVLVWGSTPESWDKPLYHMRRGKKRIVNVSNRVLGLIRPNRQQAPLERV